MPPPTAEEVKRAERLLAIERSLSDAARDQRDLLREISTELGGQEKALTTAKKQYSSLRDISNEILRNEESETKLTKEQLDKLQAKSKTNLDYLKESAKRLYTEKGVRGEINTGMVDRLKFLNKISSEEEALLRAAADGFAVEEETLKLIDARIKKTENLNKATGITGDFLKISETLLGKIGAKNLQKPFEAARKAAEKKAEALGVSEKKTASIADKFKILGASIGGFASGLTKAFSDPLAIVTSIVGVFGMMVKAALELDKNLTDFAKNMGMSKDAANELGANFDQMSYNVGQYSKNLTAGTFSIKNQMQATGELNEALGTAELFTGKMVAGQILLTKRLGLSNEEAAEFAKFSLLTNKSQEELTVEIGDQITAFKKQTGVQLNMKKVMQDVAKVSGALSANLGNDPKRIAAAVMQAQKLGITLEQSRKISSSLLDFQSSIENELEAELLTGKSLNFERARALALQGKTTEAASELLGQLGGISEFQKLNVIQQDAIAKSVGMSADEMADAYKQQELLKGTAFATKEAFLEQYKIAEQQGRLEEFKATVQQAANGEQLLSMGAQQSAQEKFQEAIDKLKETFTRIAAGPLLHMVEKFANFISNAENLKSIFDSIKNVIAFIGTVSIVKMIAGLTTTLLLTRRQAAASMSDAASKSASSAASIPIVGFGLAVGAAIATFAALKGMMNDATSVQDAAISPSGGLLISGPKGSFITDPSDQVVAAPNAASMVGGGGGISRADIDAIANRPISVNVQANTDTLLRLQTAQSQYGAPNSFA
jgi:hypothetical protein